MNIDFSKFKKIRSDSKSTTLKHPEGHQIIVAHHALSPDMKKQIQKIPTKYADGGEVEDGDRSPASMLSPEEAQAASDKKLSISAKERAALNAVKEKEGVLPSDSYGPAQPTPTIYDRVNNFLSMPGEQEQQAVSQWKQGMAANAPEAPIAGPAPASIAPQSLAPQTNPDPFGMDAYAQNYMQGVGEQKAGIQQEAAAQGQLGASQLESEKSAQQFMQRSQEDFQKNYQALQQEYQSVIHDVQNQHINPNHYMESMGSGKKVATAIGLILGGMGGGLTGQENPVAKFLNQQISNDIETQKANLGKSETLLSANLRQFGNLHDATQMTMAMQNGIYASKLRQAAAQAMDPMAKARALQMAGQLDTQAAPILQQLAMKKAALGGLQGIQDPGQKIRFGVMSGMIPQTEGEHLYKELGEAQNMVKARDNILGAFDKVASLNRITNRMTSPMQSKSQIAAIRDPLVAGLSKETAGRFTEQDAKYLDSLFPNATDNAKTIAMKKQAIEKLVSQKMHFPRLQAFGVSPYGEQRFGSGGDKKIQLGPPVR